MKSELMNEKWRLETDLNTTNDLISKLNKLKEKVITTNSSIDGARALVYDGIKSANTEQIAGKINNYNNGVLNKVDVSIANANSIVSTIKSRIEDVKRKITEIEQEEKNN